MGSTDGRYLTENKILNMSNFDLLTETIYAAGGDDYDGGFTEEGRIEYAALRKELSKRLKQYQFFKHGEKLD